MPPAKTLADSPLRISNFLRATRCSFSLAPFCADTKPPPHTSQKCHKPGAEDVDPSTLLETAAPDITNEEALFAPRSKAQEDANVGRVEEQARAGKPSLPAGGWVEAAKELVPPPPPPEVTKNGRSRVQAVAHDLVLANKCCSAQRRWHHMMFAERRLEGTPGQTTPSFRASTNRHKTKTLKERTLFRAFKHESG